MLSSSQLPKKHIKPVPGMLRLLCFSICLGIVSILCLLYVTEMMNNDPPAAEVPGHQFGNGINELNNDNEIDSLINSMMGQDQCRNSVNENCRQTETSLISRRLQDFLHEWLRQRRARVDWKNLIKPCPDNMAWGSVKEHWGKTNRSNATTSDIIFKDIRPAGEFSKIFIQSKTSDNRTKLIGGDTWRVYVRGPTSIAATVFDHNNGTYEALFLITEPGVYKLMIYLDYSLCDGLKDPPRDWFIIGYRTEGKLGPLDEYLVTQQFNNGQSAITINVTKDQLKLPISDKVQDLVSCSETCKYLWDGFGQWKNGQWMPYLKESYNWRMPQNYSQSGTFWIYGDSLGRRLYSAVQTRPLCKRLYIECCNSYMGIDQARKGLNNKLERNVHFSPELVIETVVNALRSPEMQQEESVLLLNLVLHYAKKINFTTYQRLIDDLVLALKASELSHGERIPKYKAKIIWKSSTALCKEKASSSKETEFRFFTSQRVALFHAYSLSAMCNAGFDVIDVYSLSDSYPHRCMDHVHYSNVVFYMMEKMLEKYKVHFYKKVDENEKHAKIKRCISTENF